MVRCWLIALAVGFILIFPFDRALSAQSADVQAKSVQSADVQAKTAGTDVKEPAKRPDVSKQLELLMTYTLFHLGLYSTMFALAVAYYEKKKQKSLIATGLLLLIALFLAIAGAAGGTIAGTIPKHHDWDVFNSTRFGPSVLMLAGSRGFLFPTWAIIEHYSFWLAVMLTAIFVGWVSHLPDVSEDERRKKIFILTKGEPTALAPPKANQDQRTHRKSASSTPIRLGAEDLTEGQCVTMIYHVVDSQGSLVGNSVSIERVELLVKNLEGTLFTVYEISVESLVEGQSSRRWGDIRRQEDGQVVSTPEAKPVP